MAVTIKTERLLLRPLEPSDLHTTHAYAGNPQNAKYMLFLPNDTLEDTRAFLTKVSNEWAKADPDFYEFAIILDGKHIGAVSIDLDESRTEGELGWVLHLDYWGKGYATEAALAAKDFAINELKIKKLVAHCDSRNTASYRLMEAIGMSLESDDQIRVYRDNREPSKEFKYSITLQ